MRKNSNLKKAFTLIEMLIVIVIIGILISAFLPRLRGAEAMARDTARKGSLMKISTALTEYFNEKGEYPNGNCTSDLSGNTTLQQYISDIPKDPQTNRVTYGTKNGGCEGSFGYTPMEEEGASGAGYVLVANMESFGKNMNYVLSGNNYTSSPYFSGNVDTVNASENICDEGVEMTGGTTIVPCSKTQKQGELPKNQNPRGIYVEFSN